MFKTIEGAADCEIRSVIRILNARSVLPSEIHHQICQVYGIPYRIHSLNIPRPYINYWPRDGSLELKHFANYVLMTTCVVFEYEAYSESKYCFAVKKNRVSFRIKFYCYRILHSSNYFSTYSPLLLRHLS